MKILWLTNVPLLEASRLLGMRERYSGGWLSGASEYLTSKENLELSIMFPFRGQIGGKREYRRVQGHSIQYFAFRQFRNKAVNSDADNEVFETIVKGVKPDIVHVFGTELPHSLVMMNVLNRLGIPTVVSIQGIVSKIEQHICADLPLSVLYGFTLRNIILRDRVIDMKGLYQALGENEVAVLQKAKHVIGRTTFDKACVSQINPKVMYHFCNESLRSVFYEGEWRLDQCEPNSIFLSQAHYPLKGLHYMLEAMPLILRQFPNTTLYIAGKNITKSDTWQDRLGMTRYGKYIQSMIKTKELSDKVVFTGPLGETEMRGRYLRSHVFVCPSSIENSPNSLGEAMLLGLPSIAAYVGGVPDLLTHNEEGFLYPADAPYLLAHYVTKVFEDDALACRLSAGARAKARQIHSREKNGEELLDIYNKVMSS